METVTESLPETAGFVNTCRPGPETGDGRQKTEDGGLKTVTRNS